MLKGKKTYAIAILGAIGAAANIAIKVIQEQPVGIEDIMALLGALGLGSLRAGIKNG
jgi:hypothetical protein